MGSEAAENAQGGTQSHPPPTLPGPRREVLSLSPDEKSSLITPFTVVPRWLARSTPGQIAWNALLFVLPPTVVFGYWITRGGATSSQPEFEQLRSALPLAAVWVVLSPLLMYAGERAGARWVASLAADADFGWNIERVRTSKRRIDRLYYPTALLGAAGATTALWFALPTVRDVIPVPAGWGTVVQFFVFGQAGFTAMGGLHGVIRWVVVTRAAVNGVELRWHPFRSPQHESLARSYRLSLLLGFAFSSGAFFVPALLAVVGSLEPAPRVIVWTFIVLLLAGGILIFIVPMATLVSALARGKRRFVAGIDAPLGDLLDEMTGHRTPMNQEYVHRTDAIDRMLAIRGRVVAVRLFPIGQTLSRALLTVVFPMASLALSMFRSGVLTR